MKDKELIIGLSFVEQLLKRVRSDIRAKSSASAEGYAEMALDAIGLMKSSAKLKATPEDVYLRHHEEEEEEPAKPEDPKDNLLFKKF